MSGKIAFGLVAGLTIGAAGGYLFALGKVEEAQRYQVFVAKKNAELTKENMSLQRRAETLKESVYDRQKIRECMGTSSVLSNAISNHLQGKMQSPHEQNALALYMSNVLVATQGKSRNSAMYTLSNEREKIVEECLDRARIRVPGN